MNVRFIASACVVVEHAGVRVLCDPWLSDGIYYGSWYHYPPLTIAPEDLADVDYIYISHIHPDHMDVETLKRLPKSIKVLVLEYAEKYLVRILSGLGFEVTEVPHRGSVTLGEDFVLELFAADNCDPLLCSRFLGCAPQPYGKTMWIDSLAVFRGGGMTVVNTNDCPFELAHAACAAIVDRHGTVDLALVGYSGAGEYPQCFDNLQGAAILEKAREKRAQFLSQATLFIRQLRARAVMPFAGQYTLGGRLSALNDLRGVPEPHEAAVELQQLLRKDLSPPAIVLLNSGESYDVESGQASAPYMPPDPVERQRYIDEVLSGKSFTYEGTEAASLERVDLLPLLAEAQKRLLRHQELWNYSSPWRLYLDAGGDDLYCVPFDRTPVAAVKRGGEQGPYVRISLDYALLRMILERRAHWNNASIGSHLRFFRDPDVYERAVYMLLSYLHC